MINNPSLLERLRNDRFTDSDVSLFLLGCRELGFGEFVREVGDFVAHNHRDRGQHLDRIAALVAQFSAFLWTSDGRGPIQPRGTCPWWLKPLLLSRLADLSDSKVSRICKCNRNDALKAINRSFGSNSREQFPTIVDVLIQDEPCISGLLSSSSVIDASPAHSAAKVRAQISSVLKLHDIPIHLVDKVIVGLAIALRNTTATLGGGLTVSAILSVENRRFKHHENAFVGAPGPVTLLADGELIVKYVVHDLGPKGSEVHAPLLSTGIDTEPYFDRSLVQTDVNGHQTLKLDGPLSFDSRRDPPVSSA